MRFINTSEAKFFYLMADQYHPHLLKVKEPDSNDAINTEILFTFFETYIVNKELIINKNQWIISDSKY